MSTLDPTNQNPHEDRGPWMSCTPSGSRFYPMAPRTEEVDIRDIARALSMTCRFGGHVSQFYSVAQHSVWVMRSVEKTLGQRVQGYQQIPQVLRAALLHDAAEAYCLGDVLTPFKDKVNIYGLGRWNTYSTVEKGMLNTIFTALRVNLNPWNPMMQLVHNADQVALVTEARDLKGSPDWARDFLVQPDPEHLVPLGPEAAEREFLATWDRVKQ